MYMEFRKMVTITCMGDSKRDTDIKNRLMDTAGMGRKERVGCMERITWRHTLPYLN